MSRYRIAVIPGDGIGREVVPEGIRVVEAAARRHGIDLAWEQFPGAARRTAPKAG